MADLDEAAVNSPSNGATHVDVDLSDETQDFRMLNNLSFLADTAELSLPKRGEKDFEPNPTLFQADILSASRQAMHNALSYPRVHNPKSRVIGIYAPNGPAPPKTSNTLDKDAPATKHSPASIGVHPDSCVYVMHPKGQLFKTIGRADRWSRVWLLPEEALYLLERGSLDLRWPCCAVGDGDEDDIEDSEIPMSLQAAYACLVGYGGLTMERFSVYTGLKRLGYTLTRAPGWTDGGEAEGAQLPEADNRKSLIRQGAGLAGIFTRFLTWLRDSTPTSAMGPVAGLGFHHSYSDIYRKLSLIPYYDPVTAVSSQQPELPYAVVFHVYKPSPSFRKSAPPSPDFRIAVINARTHTAMPTLAQIGSLLESTPIDAPRSDKSLYMRLRNGYRNVILAVVDQGVVSYLRVADSAFGKEKIYQTQPTRGNKSRGPPRHRFKKR
ncbi:tRNA splicing endonuclease subunit [Aspergillus californicus]